MGIDWSCEDCEFRKSKECPFHNSCGIRLIRCPKYKRLSGWKRVLHSLAGW